VAAAVVIGCCLRRRVHVCICAADELGQQRQLAAGRWACCACTPSCLPTCPIVCRGILNAEFFSWLPAGASLINLSRGQHVVDADLLAALDSGRLAGAVLDVFHQEPLSPDSPLWRHPKIRAFPHVSGITHLPSAADQMARLRALVLAGKPLPPEVVVDRQLGY
jgi:glyoxylate/hydroxypyruvate reductase A